MSRPLVSAASPEEPGIPLFTYNKDKVNKIVLASEIQCTVHKHTVYILYKLYIQRYISFPSRGKGKSVIDMSFGICLPLSRMTLNVL